MKSIDPKKSLIKNKEVNTKASDLQKLYFERMKRFMALVELSYTLRTSPRIIQSK